jgi:hypothetical protein
MPEPVANNEPRGDDSFPYEMFYKTRNIALEDDLMDAAKRAATMELTDDQRLICRHSVRGYSLESKKWRKSCPSFR